MSITKEQLIPLFEGKSKAEIVGEGGVMKTLIANLIEAAMEAEMSHHLGYSKHDSKNKKILNSRNGYSNKKIIGSFGQTEIEVPRDRAGEFEPQIVPKNNR